MNYAIAVKLIKALAVLALEGISSIHLPLQPMKNISGFFQEIRTGIPSRLYIPQKILPHRATIKLPHSTKLNTGLQGRIPLTALQQQSLSRKESDLLLDLGRNLDATSDKLSSTNRLKPIIKEVLESKVFREDPQTLLVYKAAQSQMREVNNLTLGKCNDAIRKIEASKGIKISDSHRVILAAGIMLGIPVVVMAV
jgi:hypothetical protein